MKKLNHRKLVLILAILILFLTAGFTLSGHSEKEMPQGKAGHLDLEDWDFQKDGSVKLDGYWEFYSNSLLTPKDLETENPLSFRYLQVPSRWTTKVKEGDKQKDDGIGTYRLKIKVNKANDILGLRIKNIRISYKIFINGEEIAASGNPAADIESGYVPNNVPMTVIFPLKGEADNSKTIDLVIQAANINYYNGGLIQSIYLGSEKDITWDYIKEIILDVIVVSFLILTSIYYLVIYFRRRDDKKFLYMSAFCISLAFLISTGNAKIFFLFMDQLPYLLVIKLRTATVAFSILLVCLFIREMSKALISAVPMKIIQIITVLSMTVTVAAPDRYMVVTEKAVTTIFIFTYALVALRLLYCIFFNRHEGTGKRVVIFLLFLDLQFINEYISTILYYYSVAKSFLVSNLTFVLLLLGLCYMFVDEYLRAYNNIKEVNENLVAADKIKEEFLAYASNEFKSPLQTISNITKDLLNESKESSLEDQKENLLYIRSISAKMSDTVNDIIDYQNLKNHKLKLVRKDFDIYGMVIAVLETVGYMNPGQAVTIKSTIEEKRYFITADENRLEQILYNLIVYSLKMSEKGDILLSGEEVGEEIYIRISYAGKELEDTIQAELLKAYRMEPGKEAKGSLPKEMGIYVSRLLAVNMGGDVYFESGEKKDSAIVLALPKVKLTTETLPHHNLAVFRKRNNTNSTVPLEIPKITEADFKRKEKKPKILLVDDDTVSLKFLFDVCKEEFEPIIACNGIQALEFIERDRNIKIALVDTVMPGISGYEVCRQIRNRYSIFELPVLLLSLRNATEDIETGLEAGANDFLIKPFHGKELINRVKTLRKMQEALQDAVKIETVFLQSQIKQHFLYNSLNSIVSLCYSEPERAGNLLSELSHYLRSILEIDPHHSIIELHKEITLVNSYIELEKARFGKRLQVQLDYDEGILEHRIPAFLIQPVVENAIRHGVMMRTTGGTVAVSIKKQAAAIIICIQDDGVGMSEDIVELLMKDTLDGSIGLKNVNKRLNNEYGEKLKIQSEKDVGTCVTMRIPLSIT
ncbi:histidine kinase [Anaerocolumna sp. AGMB13020]|uniref:hybrid sensor histidine kinase/response regulator n=1 Tax=Anaerocolumna sp. AGMB13020 TaxID=3081750 RepID=UPI0029532479|nr:ATP-binding protein [Anaerocolumna sp. AGMB13020]WOO37761.1 histidine kinase [Anaerocolumna sp. AGMB13020]